MPYERTDEENKAISQAETKEFFARKKLERHPPKQYIDPEKVDRMLKSLHQPEPRLRSDYDRSIIKSTEATEWAKDSTGATSRRTVPQLGEQKKQSCPPLKVYNLEVIQGFPTYDELDPEIIKEYKEVADAQGMTIPQYLSQL